MHAQMDLFQGCFTPGSKVKETGQAVRRWPTPGQDAGILLPGDRLYFYSRLLYFPYRTLQL